MGSYTTTNQDLFLIERYLDGYDRIITIVYGFGWQGTYAAGRYTLTAMFPALAHHYHGWVIVKWEDTNGDGFVNNPSDGDTYTVIAAGH